LNQRRYHQRQEEKRAEYEAQLKEVAQRMEMIEEENAMLRLKQRQLFMSMTTWQDHLEALIGRGEAADTEGNPAGNRGTHCLCHRWDLQHGGSRALDF